MIFFGYPVSVGELVIFYLVALFVGMAKTGVHGAGMLSVPLLALAFGGQSSAGILLPVLCMADLLGLWYYHRHADWAQLKKLFPWAAVGTIIGTVVGDRINDTVFKIIMAIAILASIAIMVWLERKKYAYVPDSKPLSALTGIAGGFTSMVGNLAGPLMAVYFLSMRLPKYVFIGTTAWFFLVINFFKVPFHVFYWETITIKTLLMDLTTIPAIMFGAWLGILIVKNLSEKFYRWFIIIMTMVAAVFMVVT